MIAEPNAAKDEEWVSIARIARPQGVRGEVIAEILTDFPDRFADLDKVTVIRGGTVLGALKLENHWFHKGRIVLKFADYDDANRAEELRDASVVIHRDELVELGEDEYFVFDLEGCEVMTMEGQQIGKVVKVEDYGAAPLLVVAAQSKEHLIPLTHDICPEVDTVNKKIVVNLPEGLLDL